MISINQGLIPKSLSITEANLSDAYIKNGVQWCNTQFFYITTDELNLKKY